MSFSSCNNLLKRAFWLPFGGNEVDLEKKEIRIVIFTCRQGMQSRLF